jgi:signal peptidase I
VKGTTPRIIHDRLLIDGKETSPYIVNHDPVFTMGDNRDDSLDSRFLGLVSLKDVIGTPILSMLVLGSPDSYL